jgi:hypothetical protein
MIPTAENEQEIKAKIRQEKIEQNKKAFLEMTAHVHEGMKLIYHERFTFLCTLESMLLDEDELTLKLKYIGYVGDPPREDQVPHIKKRLSEKEVELGFGLQFLNMDPQKKEVWGYGGFYVRFSEKCNRSSIFFSKE